MRFKPVSEGLDGDYPPALVFTDGSVALFVAQFDCFPMDSLAAVRALPSDLNNQLVPRGGAEIRVPRCRGPVLLDGRRSATAETTKRTPTCCSAPRSPVETPDMVGILDPQLPAWIQRLADAVGARAASARYTQELGALREVQAHHAW